MLDIFNVCTRYFLGGYFSQLYDPGAVDIVHVWLLSPDDVIKWKHFPRYWHFVRGIHRSPVNSAHKGQWRGALMFSFICAWTNGWVNNDEAGDLRRHRAHCDVIVMEIDSVDVSVSHYHDQLYFVLMHDNDYTTLSEVHTRMMPAITHSYITGFNFICWKKAQKG